METLGTGFRRVNPILAILIGPGLALVSRKTSSFSKILIAIKRSFVFVPSQNGRTFLRSSDGEVIPRRLPLALVLSVLQIVGSVYTLFIAFVLIGYENSDSLTLTLVVVPALAVLVLILLQYRIIAGDPSTIDKGVEAILGSGEWILSSDVLPSSISELRPESNMARQRLGVSIEAISVEEIERGHDIVSRKAQAMGMTVDQYCATAFHRRNSLDPDECEYLQGESLAAALTDR